MAKKLKVKPGDVAICMNGHVGLVLGIHETHVYKLWVGIHLSPKRLGDYWESFDPTRVGNIQVLLTKFLPDNVELDS